ncbi:MAG: hypothetical protein RLZZ312_39 [Bacteroidota bacterium]|jgi:tetratricopeptide (TPR) repeat protein
MKKTKNIGLAIVLFSVLQCFAQTNPEDIASNPDEFQLSFFESIKQKGIENYDKALESLEKCLKLDPQNATVFFEIGKNQLELKKWKESYDAFEKSSTLDPKNRWSFHGMYDVCYRTQDYFKAIEIVQKLVSFDAGYREDLASLLMKTQQFDKALTVINDLNATVGKSEKRELYKAQILNNPQNQSAEIKYLTELISKNPKDESNYNALILLLTKAGQDKDAEKIAAKLEIEIPTSEYAQIGLFKKQLAEKEGKGAVIAMNKVLSSEKIDNKIKHRVLNEFLIFVKNNDGFDTDLENAVNLFKSETNIKIAKEVAKFFQGKQNWAKAIPFYELELKNNPTDIESMILVLECYLQSKQHDVLIKKANTTVELFPLQPQPYLYAAMGYNQLKNFKKAKETLTAGLDFVVDAPAVELGFYQQLAIVYDGLSDSKNKVLSQRKADELKAKYKL